MSINMHIAFTTSASTVSVVARSHNAFVFVDKSGIAKSYPIQAIKEAWGWGSKAINAYFRNIINGQQDAAKAFSAISVACSSVNQKPKNYSHKMSVKLMHQAMFRTLA